MIVQNEIWKHFLQLKLKKFAFKPLQRTGNWYYVTWQNEEKFFLLYIIFETDDFFVCRPFYPSPPPYTLRASFSAVVDFFILFIPTKPSSIITSMETDHPDNCANRLFFFFFTIFVESQTTKSYHALLRRVGPGDAFACVTPNTFLGMPLKKKKSNKK